MRMSEGRKRKCVKKWEHDPRRPTRKGPKWLELSLINSYLLVSSNYKGDLVINYLTNEQFGISEIEWVEDEDYIYG